VSDTREKLHELLGRHFVAEAELIDLIQDEKAGRVNAADWRQVGRELSAIATDFHELRRQHLAAASSPRSAGGQEPFSAEVRPLPADSAPDASASL
jgi:hypothetical protein